MIRNRILLKSLTVFLVIEMLANTVAPAVSWALTSGPTAPEATSFEPVDTPEMVDLTTGDMLYNIPLLEVPGPGGSYPISISYHAGISPATDASWVGLGWNINPGSILRSVSGYPDDWKDVSSQNSESWVGGTTQRVSKGLSVSYWGLSLSAGVIKTNDTYKGSGRGGYTSIGYGYKGAAFSVGFSQDPASGSAISVGGGYMKGTGNSAAQVGVSLGMNSVFTMSGSSTSMGLSAGIFASTYGAANGASLLGVSINTNGTASVSVAGIGLNGGHLDHSGKVTVESNSNLSFGQQAGIYFGTGTIFDYSDDYIKYSINEVQNSHVNGALYPMSAVNPDMTYFDDKDFDVYDMVEVASGDEDPTAVNTPKFGVGNEISLGGTLPATDNYMVMGQGTGGLIKPYDLLGTLYRQNKKNKDDNYITKQYAAGSLGALPVNQGDAEFMFMNEFSNRFLYDESGSGEYFGSGATSMALAFHPDKVSTGPEVTGDKTINNKLGRASNIEWYKNSDLIGTSIPDVLLSPNAKGFVRASNDQVGAFKVTNPSGVTYYYALPAYTSNEEYYTENVAHDLNKAGDFRTIVRRNAPYAYAWYLTAVTGPDYVDRGDPGLSPDDWGYCIEFEYGKWSSDYKWRTPEAGFVDDLDGNFRNYSRGQKELYYLNAIRSATHTALFIKDVRRDGKGLTNNGSIKNGGQETFSPSPCGNYPTSTLKLSKIILIENDHLPNVDYSYNNSFQPIACTREIPNPDDLVGGMIVEPYEIDVHHGENVLLSENISEEQMTTLEQYSLKRIALETDDTQMMPNTTNSFSNEGLYTPNPVFSDQKLGKLELKAIQVFGRGPESLIPPMRFDYKNKTTPYDKDKMDYWGFYKSDYDATIKDVNLRRMTTNVSAQNVDTWSLNKIVTSLGAEIHINYESDDYEKSVLHNKVNFPITRMETLANGQQQIFMEDLTGELDKHFSIGENVKSLLVIAEARKHSLKFAKFTPVGIVPDGCARMDYFKLEKVTPFYNNAIIRDIGSDFLSIEIVDEMDEKPPTVPGHTDTGFSFGELANVPTEVVPLAEDSNPDQSLLTQCQASEARTEHFKDFIGGEIMAEINENQQGGGLRVREIQLVEPQSSLIYSTTYDYTNPLTGKSSGVTTYVPFRTNQFVLNYPETYEDAVEGYYSQGNMLTGGAIANVIKNWEVILRTLMFTSTKLSPVDNLLWGHLIDYYHLKEAGDRTNMNAFLGAALSTRDDVAENKRIELMSDLLSKVNEVPAANAMYEYVTIRNRVIHNGQENDNQSYVVNQFIVYDESMVTIQATHEKTITDLNSDEARKLMKRGVTINNFGNAVGQMKSSRIYATDGTLLSEKINHYLHELDNTSANVLENYANKLATYNSQGVLDETYVTGRYMPYDNDIVDDHEGDNVQEKEVFYHDAVGVVTKRRSLPIIMLAEENRNYKTGITTIATNLAFDFYSGNVSKNISADGYGNMYLSEVIPAYEKYPGMQLGINGGKHMLSQAAANYTYKVDPANINAKLGLVSASAQTWSDHIQTVQPGQSVSSPYYQSGIWRMKGSYSFVGDNTLSIPGDGFYSLSGKPIPYFTSWDGSDPNMGWQKDSEITLYDVNSHALQASDLNDNHAATKMTFDHTRILVTGANCDYNELAYSGAEETPQQISNTKYFGGEVVCEGATSSDQAHTGSFSVKADPTNKAFSYSFTRNVASATAPPASYVVSFWSSKAQAGVGYTINGSARPTPTVRNVGRAGDWFLMEAIIPNVNNNDLVHVWNASPSALGVTYFDDFRVSPIDAAVVSYVYNKWGELSNILDNNNLYTQYDYDGMGRLIGTRKETLHSTGTQIYGSYGVVTTSAVQYNYGQNNPYMVTVNSTSSGTPGTIVPYGNSSVSLGSEITYKLDASPCNFPYTILLDGKLNNSSTYNFLDGTVAFISSGQVALKNVQGPHTIEAQFYTPPTGGLIRCNFQGEISDMCYDGSYQYAEYDGCGGLGDFKFAPTWQSIPASVRGQQASFNCCEQSTCYCVPHN